MVQTSDSSTSKLHELKCHPAYFQQTWDNNKFYEIRINDRDFKVGDKVLLREWSINGGYTGREMTDEITSVIEFPAGLRNGYVVLGLDYEMLDRDSMGRMPSDGA
jgi:hypothetical protein